MRRTSGVHTEGLYIPVTEATLTSPTVRMRQLGMELQRLRKAARKTQEAAAEYIGVTESTMSKYETGDRKVKLGYVRSLCELYDAEPSEAEFLVRLAQQSNQRGWWADYGNTVPTWFKQFVGMEAAARQFWTYEPLLVPGLLQTPEYFEAVATDPDIDIGQAAQIRDERKKRLRGDPDPLQVHAILDEAVLRRDVGGAETMRRQIRHLVEMGRLANVTIQVLPFSVGSHPAMTGSFTALRFPNTPQMDTVFVEIRGGAVYVEKLPDVERYINTFQRLMELALSEEATERLLNDEIERR